MDLPHISSSENNYNSALLHRRLSIIDLSDSGHQPMSYNDGNLWITFNGEIYNYLEIKGELINKGYRFISNSDTEVMLTAYQEWGEKCVERFNGMWAFAIYDRQKQLIFCSRDRLGIKPFYYSQYKEEFVFCSEIKGIRFWFNNQARLNEDKIREYLIMGQVIIGASRETLFNDIYQLMPGHNLTYSITDKKYSIYRFWELGINISKNQSFNFYQDTFSELFKDSIKFRLRSDVEVGSCLSGGLDSSSIVCFGSSEFKKQFNTFSAVWPGTNSDEANYIKIANNHSNSKGNLITYNDLDDFIDFHNKVMWHQELPLAGSSVMAQWLVMKEARRNKVPVLLDGQGGDEILSGYPAYINSYINELFYRLKWQEFFKNRDNWNYNGYSYTKLLKTLIKNKIKKVETNLPITGYQHNLYQAAYQYSLSSKCNFLPVYLKEQIEKTNLPVLLHYEDRNSMAHSVEARLPFLDYRLVEFTVNIPTQYKFKGTLQKTILRESMKPYLPTPIYERRDKIGFSTPIEQNIIFKNQDLFCFMENYLKKSDIWKYGWIDTSKYVKDHLFPLYSLATFIETFK
ncbi:MAG: asparagine synthase (glutamine-hydrolyzing) [Bacteroidetes bacterium]|nr:MAG: asparagine synthase (glutamine-hydrolyzing) [Bacteroidota bacterium]